MTVTTKADNLYIELLLMTTVILIFAVIILIGLIFGATILFILRRSQSSINQETAAAVPREKVPFRLSYIMAPLIVLLVLVALSAVFFGKLPAQVGYHFGPDGTPDRWFSPQAAVALMLVPSVVLTLLSVGLTRGIIKLGILSGQQEVMGLKPRRLMQILGNLAALPQIVLSFVIFDIFSYNAYGIHTMSALAFILLLVIVCCGMGVGLLYIIYRARKKAISQPEEQK